MSEPFHRPAKPLILKPLCTELLPAVLELDQRCFGGLWTLEGYQRELESPNSDLLVLATVIDEQEVIIGSGCYWAILEEAHITIVAIDPTYQRQGLGQVMLHALLSAARQRGLERATLEVRISNQAALTLYEKFGFQEAGRRRRYYPDTGEDALVLWLSQLQSPQFQRKLQEWQQQIDDRLRTHHWQLMTHSS